MSETDTTPSQRAMPYAHAGIKLFPVRWDPESNGHKAPMPNYPWRARATSDPSEVVQDFVEAEMLWGIDHVAIAWATGEDGYVVVDVDSKEIPAWTQQFDYCSAVNETGKGWHFITRFPDAFEPGNSTQNLPDNAGVDVRGKGGYIIIDAPDRPGFQIAELRKCQPFPRPDWLLPYGGQVDHATRAEIVAFAKRHVGASQMGSLDGIRTMLTNFDERRKTDKSLSRHMEAVGIATQVAIESIKGWYPFADGLAVVHDWFKAHLAADKDRPVQRYEWAGIVSWAVGKALLQERSLPTDDSTGQDTAEALGLDGITGLDDSFQPVDLAEVLSGHYLAPTPSVLKRDDRMALLYRGQINGIHGDSGLGKGWVALYAAAEQLLAGSTVMMLDLEDVPSSIVSRLRLLGAQDQAIAERFIYIRPSATFDRAAVEHLEAIVASRRVALVIIDSLGEAFGLEGIDENHDAEVGPWLRRVPRRIADVTGEDDYAGPAVLLVDHVTKVNDNPLHPSGSKRKRAAVGGAQYWIQAPAPLSIDTGGRLRLVCAKDRHGTYARNQHVADLVIKIEGPLWDARLYSPLAADDSLGTRMKSAIEHVVEVMIEIGKPCSRNVATFAMGMQRSKALEAITLAIEVGAIALSEDGKRILLPSWEVLPQGAVEELPDQEV